MGQVGHTRQDGTVTEGLSWSGRAGADSVVDPGAAVCTKCGAPIVVPAHARRLVRSDSSLCLSCDRRARRSAYFRSYYEAHRDRILDKNRKWARENRERLVHLRRARQLRKNRAADEPRRCLDCGEVVVRALRCRRCYTRYRYATDPEYRVRRLATTRRWLERRRSAQAEAGRTQGVRLASRPVPAPPAPTTLTA
jgi:hypothetical protein